MSNPGNQAVAFILRVPDEAGLARLDINEGLLSATGRNSVCGWSDPSCPKNPLSATSS